MRHILVTGASGFIGSLLCPALLAAGWRVRGASRSSGTPQPAIAGLDSVRVGPLGPDTAWREALSGIDTVIHLAARVHVMVDPAADPLAEFRLVNVAGSERLARESALAGVRRLVYVSSVKVHGDESTAPYSPQSPDRPSDPYGISKKEAELALWRIGRETGMEVVVVRPPLVYGPGVKGNFLRMMDVVHRGIPLPLASLSNRRSLVYAGNLVEALMACAVHPAAPGNTFLVSDGDYVSTPELIRVMARAMGRPVRLFRFPPIMLRLAGKLLGKGAAIDRLIGSLMVDCAMIRKELGWTPRFGLEEGMRRTAEWYLSGSVRR